MRVVQKEEDLKDMLEEAQGEAERAFETPLFSLRGMLGGPAPGGPSFR